MSRWCLPWSSTSIVDRSTANVALAEPAADNGGLDACGAWWLVYVPEDDHVEVAARLGLDNAERRDRSWTAVSSGGAPTSRRNAGAEPPVAERHVHAVRGRAEAVRRRRDDGRLRGGGDGVGPGRRIDERGYGRSA